MKITICDDCIEDLSKLEKLLLKYKQRCPNRSFELARFTDPSRLYQRLLDGEWADLYILDMLMPYRTGIDLGSRLRKLGCENPIIYVTSSSDFALDAYEVRAVRYLLKPVSEERFFEAVDYALSYTAVKKEPLYLVKTKDGVVQTPYSRIEYVENSYRKLEVHLTDGDMLKSLFIRQSFEGEVQELAEKSNFLQVHKSFLVNLDYVKRLDADGILMESGALLPVSRSRAAKAKREYLLFVSEKYR